MNKRQQDLEDLHKKVFREFFDEAKSSRIVSNIMGARNSLFKGIFTICFLLSSAYCIYSITVLTLKYYKYESVTSLKIVQETPTNFPVVSFCNLKAFSRVSPKKEFKNIFGKNNEHLDDSLYGDDIFEFFNDETEMIESNILHLNDSDDFRRSLGFQLKDMLLTCYFNWKKCTAKDFQTFFHPFFGNCFSFNNDKRIKQASLQGPHYGLSMELFVGDPKIQVKHDLGDGIILTIHNQSKIPHLNSDRILVSTGTETDLKINRHFISKLGPPYSKCLKRGKKPDINSEFFDYIVYSLKLNYSQQYCYLLCLQKQIISACECSSIWLPKYKNTTYCTYDKHHHAVMAKILAGEKNSEDCVTACPLECEFVDYKISSNQATFPTQYYEKLLSKHSIINSSGIYQEDIRRSVLRINVFYETMTSVTIIEAESMSSQTFFSNIGGTLSLCLGISILSVIEIFELFLKLIDVYKRVLLERRKLVSQNENEICLN